MSSGCCGRGCGCDEIVKYLLNLPNNNININANDDYVFGTTCNNGHT